MIVANIWCQHVNVIATIHQYLGRALPLQIALTKPYEISAWSGDSSRKRRTETGCVNYVLVEKHDDGAEQHPGPMVNINRSAAMMSRNPKEISQHPESHHP